MSALLASPHVIISILLIAACMGGALVYLLVRPQSNDQEYFEDDWDSFDLDSGWSESSRNGPTSDPRQGGLMGSRLASTQQVHQDPASPVLSAYELDLAAHNLQPKSPPEADLINEGSGSQGLKEAASNLSQSEQDRSEHSIRSPHPDSIDFHPEAVVEAALKDAKEPEEKGVNPEFDPNLTHSTMKASNEPGGMDPWVKKLRAIHGGMEALDHSLITPKAKFNEKG